MEKELSILLQLKQQFKLGDLPPTQYSPLTLAYIGDCIYDLVIRSVIVLQGNAPVNKLHQKVSSLVKAQAQAKLYNAIQPYLSEEENAIYKRGRNAKSFTTAKNASIVDYRVATGVEALMGYLYLSDNMNRVIELIDIGLNEKES